MKLFSVLFFISSFVYSFSQSIESYEIKLIEKLEKVHFEKDYNACMNLNEEFLSIKSTTTDKLGAVGNREGIACYCSALIQKK